MTETFNDLYRHELEVLLSAERQMVNLLPRLADGTETAELQHALRAQVDGCRGQAELLERLLQEHGGLLRVSVSRGIQALLLECSELLQTYPTGNLRDAVMIAHMQRAEHFKIAAYSTLAEYAKLLGDKAGADALTQAAKAVALVSKMLGAIGIQVDAEAYVDTRLPGT